MTVMDGTPFWKKKISLKRLLEMSDEWVGSYGYYASISALLLAGDIKATVVENPDHRFVKVWLVSGGAFMWSRTDEGWVYTAVTPEGEVKGGVSPLDSHTEVEGVAKMIATFDYREVLDFPEEHPADLELDLANL